MGIGSYLTEKEQKNKLAQFFLRHNVQYVHENNVLSAIMMPIVRIFHRLETVRYEYIKLVDSVIIIIRRKEAI